MSFIDGIVNFGKKAVDFVSDDNVASTLLRTAALGYIKNKISDSVNKSESDDSDSENIDEGVRVQVDPDPQYQIPTLYGRAVFGGGIFDAEMSSDNKTMWFAIALTEKNNSSALGTSLDYTWHEVWRNNKRIVFKSDGVTADYAIDQNGQQDESVDGLVQVRMYKGPTSSDQINPEGFTIGSPQNAYDVVPRWNNVGDPGIVFAIVTVEYNNDKGVTSLGDFRFDLENNYANPGVAIDDYMRASNYGLGLPDAEINTTSLQTLETYSNQSISYTDDQGSSVVLNNRYQINGLIDNSNSVLENLEKIANAAGSWVKYDAHTGEWGIVVNKSASPVASFDDDNILGNVQVGGTGLTDLYTGVKVQFANRDVNDTSDFIKILLPDSDLNPNEPENVLNLSYDLVNEQVQAELLGFLELKQSRVDLVVNFEADYSYISLKAGDVIEVSNDRLGFDTKLFRVVTVTERQNDQGALIVSISALEYDDSIYNTPDITRYKRITDDGIATIRSLTAPSKPTITKLELDSRPRVQIETTTPSGIVSGIEFWITTDTDENNDSNRNYNLLTTRRPENGNTFGSNVTVQTEEDGISTSDFYIKARAFNSETTSPFSPPSAFISFERQQKTDAVDENTDVVDSLGNKLLTLAITTLLNNLDDLFSGDASEGGLFDQIFDIFTDETGTDIRDKAKNDDLGSVTVNQDGSVVTESTSDINIGKGLGVNKNNDGSITLFADIPVEDSGTEVASTSRFDFGNGLSVSQNNDGSVTIDVSSVPQQVTQQNLANLPKITSCPNEATYGNSVTVGVELYYFDCDKTLNLPYEITGDITASDLNTPLSGDVTVQIKDGEIKTTNFTIETVNNGQSECKNLILTINGCVTCEFDVCPEPAEPPPEPPDCELVLVETLPNDKNSWDLSCGLNPPLVPETGSYFLRFAVEDSLQSEKPFVTDFKKGSGGFFLYKSDGTLVENLPVSDVIIHNDVVELPFVTRDLGADYYITWSRGSIVYCGCENRALDSGTALNFTVAPYTIDPYVLQDDMPPTNVDVLDTSIPEFDALKVSSITPSSRVCSVGTITVEFSEAIAAGSGDIKVIDVDDNSVALQLSASNATVNGSTMEFNVGTSFTKGKTYQIDVPEGIAETDRGTIDLGVCGVSYKYTPNNVENDVGGARFTVAPQLELIDYTLCSDPFDDPEQEEVNIRSNIELEFNKEIALSANSAPIEIYENGALLQTIDLRDTYNNDNIGEIYQTGTKTIRLNPTLIMQPGFNYHINIPADTILDPECSNQPLPAITDSSTISWTTDSIKVNSISGYNEKTQDNIAAPTLSFELDRPIKKGSGELAVKDSQGNTIGTIPLDSNALEIKS